MAEKLSCSSNIDRRKAVPGNPYPVNRLERQLSRTITQPRALYEALDAYGPILAPVPRVEAEQVDEAYQSLQETHLSGARSKDNNADTVHTNPISDGSEDLESQVRGQSSRTHGRSSRKLTDEEWAKRILTRPTGYGCLQRGQVAKYISHLEGSVNNLQMEVSTLSSRLDVLVRHRWIMHQDNDALKGRFAELSGYDILKQDQNEALKKEVQQLQHRLEQQEARNAATDERVGLETVIQGDSLSDLEGLIEKIQISDTSHSQAEEAERISHVQGLRQDQCPTAALAEEADKFSHVQELPGPSDGDEHAKDADGDRHVHDLPRDQSDSSTCLDILFPREDDGKASTLSLVKLPSTLYRSVSAIRKDVLDEVLREP